VRQSCAQQAGTVWCTSDCSWTRVSFHRVQPPPPSPPLSLGTVRCVHPAQQLLLAPPLLQCWQAQVTALQPTLRNLAMSSSDSVFSQMTWSLRSVLKFNWYGVVAMRLASTTSPMPSVLYRTPALGLQYGSL
jgi:hypothetical protein